MPPHGLQVRCSTLLRSTYANQFFLGAKSNRRKPGQDAARFKTDEESGKMIIDENSDVEEDTPADAAAGAGTAYIEGMTSVDGFTRGPTGKIKFNKDTKKRRREEAAQDVEMADAELPAASKPKKPKRKDEPKFGHEFKAKVSVLSAQCMWLADDRRRKRAATSKKAGWTPTPTYHFRKRRRAPRRARAASRASDEMPGDIV